MLSTYPPVTDEEKEILSEFRRRISDIQLDDIENDDICVIRWVRARNYDLDKAERMIRRSWEWREANDFGNILSWVPPLNYDLYFPYHMCGFDENGSPVTIVPVCEWEIYVRKELLEGRKEFIHRFLVQLTAKVMALAKSNSNMQQGKIISQCVVIFDLFGFNIRHLTSVSVPEVLLESFRNFERNFPESLCSAFVINAPSLFALLFPIVKKMLAAKTISKVQLFDGNSIKWKKALLSEISPSNLPIRYGGTLNDILQKKIDAAKLVSDTGGLGMSGISLDGLNTVVIEAGSRLNLDFDIRDENIKISWIFRSDGHDIGFLIAHLKNEVVTKRRATADAVHEGSYVCLKTGKYTVAFDNTYSLFRAKTLHYLITVEDSKYDSTIIENAK